MFLYSGLKSIKGLILNSEAFFFAPAEVSDEADCSFTKRL